MAGVNKVILLGHLGKDPEIRTLDSGKKVAKFTMATTETYKNKNGERVDKTEWHNIVFWGPVVDVIEKYLNKGRQVYVEGKITTRSYDDKDGVKKYITEIEGQQLTLLGGKSTSGADYMDSKDEIISETIKADDTDDLPF
ncbi:MAG: single-stranded DNA-binding protein [Cytophagaceae bacterium]|nr:single-stranded DNA-binding protein [Cytophagaceae bacterium]MDW8456226.1 single-stranded DNA-binding protein [Cytophagaceae bacterium]